MKNENKVDWIVEKLDKKSNESNADTIEYLANIIKGLQSVSPKPVNSYLDVTMWNMGYRE